MIGALRVSLSADSANFEAGMRRAQRQAATSSAAISKSLGVIKSGLAGFAAGISVGLISNVIKNALDYAGSLGEVAQQLGVTTKELQTFRFAAQQNGASLEEADNALGKFSISISKALSGSKQMEKAFGAVGVKLDDLRTKTRSEIMGQIADQMVKTGGASANAAAGVAIFGRGFQKIIPTLDQGSAGLNNLAQAAERLGIVLSDEQIQKADETADKLDAVKTVLATQIAGVVADNAQSILSLSSAIANLTGEILKFLNSNPQLALGIMGALAGGRVGGLPGAALGGIAGMRAGRAMQEAAASGNMDVAFRKQELAKARKRFDAARRKGFIAPPQMLKDTREELKRQTELGQQAVASATRPKPVAVPGTPSQFLATGGGGGRKPPKDRSAEELERKRLEALRDSIRFDEDQRRAEEEILAAQQRIAGDYQDRSAIAIQLLDLQRENYRVELQHEVQLKELTQAQADAKLATYDRRDSLERQAVLQEREEERQRRFEQFEEQSFDIRRNLLETQAGIATTAHERRQIELQILELTYQEKKQALERLMSQSKDADEIERARRDLAALPSQRAADTAGVMAATRGPMETFLAGIPDTAAETQEAFERLKVQGIEGVIDSIIALQDGFSSMRDTAIAAIKDIIAQMIRMALMKAALNIIGGSVGPDIGALNAAGSSMAGFTATLPKFAGGGWTGGMGRSRVAGVVHGQEYVLNAAATRRLGVPNLQALNRGAPLAAVNNNEVSSGGGTFNINVTAPNTGDPRRDRQTSLQHAAIIRGEIARANNRGY